jgi:hypothetical protein
LSNLTTEGLSGADPSITEALNAVNDVKQPSDLVMKLKVSTSMTTTLKNKLSNPHPKVNNNMKYCDIPTGIPESNIMV